MSKLTKLETLQKAVVDIEAAFVAAFDAAADSWDDDYTEVAAYAAYDAWVKAKLELANYLKEQDNG